MKSETAANSTQTTTETTTLTTMENNRVDSDSRRGKRNALRFLRTGVNRTNFQRERILLLARPHPVRKLSGAGFFFPLRNHPEHTNGRESIALGNSTGEERLKGPMPDEFEASVTQCEPLNCSNPAYSHSPRIGSGARYHGVFIARDWLQNGKHLAEHSLAVMVELCPQPSTPPTRN